MGYAHKLTPQQICRIPVLLDRGETISSIARIFEVTSPAVRSVILEEKWKQYADEPQAVSVRCLGCGGKVVDDTKPCLVCILERKKEQSRKERRLLQREGVAT